MPEQASWTRRAFADDVYVLAAARRSQLEQPLQTSVLLPLFVPSDSRGSGSWHARLAAQGSSPYRCSQAARPRLRDTADKMPEWSTTSAPDAVGTKPRPPGARRIVNILGAVLVGVVLPVVVIGALVGHFGASAMFLGLLLGVLGSKLGGTRRMLYLARQWEWRRDLERAPPMAGGGRRCSPPWPLLPAAGSGLGGSHRC